MNVYQKLAFGVTVVLVLAWLAKDNLVMIIMLAAVVALLTLPMTWKIVFSVCQMAGILLAGIGHGVGWVGDVIIGWSEQQRLGLNAAQSTPASTVPEWGSSELQTPVASATDAEPSEELDIPDFLKDEKRADNAGLEIFEPADN